MISRNLLVSVLAFSGCLTLPGHAQTPLAQAFAEMRSSDPAAAQRARSNIINVFDQELPTIEKDTSTLCNALGDSDSYIRLQAAGILVAIVRAAPEHNQVVLSCIPELLVTASDPADRVRNDSLWALAMNPAGPPSQAQKVFKDALHSDNLRTAEVGAAGLIREDGGRNTANHELVAEALQQAPDGRHRLNLLYAINGSKVSSDTLFRASKGMLNDTDPDVQHAAIDAVVVTGTDKATVASALQSVEASPSAAPAAKRYAQMLLKELGG